jgi:superfamily II DNA/RNA helicase
VSQLVRLHVQELTHLFVCANTTVDSPVSRQVTQLVQRQVFVTSKTLNPKPQQVSQLVQVLVQTRRLHVACKVMVFFSTCWTVDYLARVLPRLPACADLEILGLHGKLEQKKRDKALRAFVRASSAVLLCTDVAARGLDIPAVSWVVQFDAPQDPDNFLHRIGRTRRMGSKVLETENRKPETGNPKPETRDPKPETRNPKPETRSYPPHREQGGRATTPTRCVA